MKTYTLKLKAAYSSVHYALYDNGVAVSDADVTSLFSQDGMAYFVFDFNGASATASSWVDIYSVNSGTKLVQISRMSQEHYLDAESVYKATWRGITTAYSYREVDTWAKMPVDQAYGLTTNQLTRLVDKIDAKQDELTAGTGITIAEESGALVISSTGGGADTFTTNEWNALWA